MTAKTQINLGNDHSIVFAESDTLNDLDLENYGGKVFILTESLSVGKEKYLLVMDEAGKPITKVDIPVTGTRFYRSCDNKIYVGNVDSLRQVQLVGDSVYFDPPITTSGFEAIMKNCSFLDDGVLFKQVEVPSRMSSLLYAIYNDEHGKKIESVVFEVKDTLAVKKYAESGIVTIYDKAPRTGRSAVRNTRSSTSVDSQMGKTNRQNSNWTGQRVILSASRYHVPVNLLLNYHDENFYVFDYTNGSIACINRFLSERKMINVEGFSNNKLIRDVFCDRATGDFFCFEKTDIGYALKKYDHRTGRLMMTKYLQNSLSPDDVMIYNNRLYFLIRKTNSEPIFLVKVIELE